MDRGRSRRHAGRPAPTLRRACAHRGPRPVVPALIVACFVLATPDRGRGRARVGAGARSPPGGWRCGGAAGSSDLFLGVVVAWTGSRRPRCDCPLSRSVDVAPRAGGRQTRWGRQASRNGRRRPPLGPSGRRADHGPLTWVRAVAGLTTSRAPISSLSGPPTPATHLALALGELAQVGGGSRPVGLPGELADGVRVTDGASRAPPSTAVRIASSSGPARVLRQEAAAPAARVEDVLVPRTWSARSPRITEVGGGHDPPGRSSPSMPAPDVHQHHVRPGRAALTAARPSAARPRGRSVRASSSARRPSRTRSWSSTISTRIIRRA